MKIYSKVEHNIEFIWIIESNNDQAKSCPKLLVNNIPVHNTHICKSKKELKQKKLLKGFKKVYEHKLNNKSFVYHRDIGLLRKDLKNSVFFAYRHIPYLHKILPVEFDITYKFKEVSALFNSVVQGYQSIREDIFNQFTNLYKQAEEESQDQETDFKRDKYNPIRIRIENPEKKIVRYSFQLNTEKKPVEVKIYFEHSDIGIAENQSI
jgi:hypothetical protein